MKKIVVIGSINIDIFLKTNIMPQIGETVIGESIELLNGGKGCNQAVAAARLGGDVSFIGAVGDDDNGKFALKNLENEGINTSFVKIIPGVSTGVANVVSCNTDNSIIIVAGANEHVDEVYIENCQEKIIEADIILIQNEIPISGIKKAIELANEHHKIIVYNPAPFINEAVQLADEVTYCIPNEFEAQKIKTHENLIITLGAKGVKYNEQIFAANKVSVVDTTGAGDTFCGAYCVSIANGNKPKTAIEFAQKASSIAIQSVGAQTGMPHLKDIL